MENKSLEQRMETEPVHRVILSLAAPTVLSMLVISAYSIVDTFFVTRLGSRATGAVGITFALVAWIQAVGYTVGMGAGSLVSRLLGKKEKEQAEQIANSAIMSGLLLGLISLGAGLIFLTPLLKLSGATTELLPYAREYALFVLLSAPFTIETLVLGTLLRAQGRAKASMAGMVTGGILDIILTPVFLFVLNLGVKGAALAAFIGQAAAAMVLGGCFWHGRMKLNGKKQSKNFFKIKDYGSIIKNGLPSLCRQGFASVAAVLLNRQAVGYGDAAVAAMSVDGRLFMVFFFFFIGEIELSVNFCHVGNQIEYFVRITDFVVIPRNDFYECVGQSYTSFCVENRSASITQEVRRYNSVFGITENAFQFAFGSLFHSSADFCISSRFSQVNC